MTPFRLVQQGFADAGAAVLPPHKKPRYPFPLQSDKPAYLIPFCRHDHFRLHQLLPYRRLLLFPPRRADKIMGIQIGAQPELGYCLQIFLLKISQHLFTSPLSLQHNRFVSLRQAMTEKNRPADGLRIPKKGGFGALFMIIKG